MQNERVEGVVGLHYEGYGFLSGWAYRRATARLARITGAGSVGDDRASRFEAWRSFMEPVYSFAGASARDLAYDADEGIPLGNGF